MTSRIGSLFGAPHRDDQITKSEHWLTESVENREAGPRA